MMVGVRGALLLYLSLVWLGAEAGSQGSGRVDVNGSIVETACAIDTPSRYQVVDMGVVSIGRLNREGRGSAHPFSIRLIACSLSRPSAHLSPWRYFQVTFEGQSENEAFVLAGDARGIAVQIADEAGNIASPGLPLLPKEVTPGGRVLSYFLRLVGNGAVLRAGEYNAVVRFRMDYY